jgi:dTDP-4-dehydrorhamnose reductase
MTRVLVLGTTGMLGAMVWQYLRANQSLLTAAAARGRHGPAADEHGFLLDAERDLGPQLEPILGQFAADYVINCIGIINIYCRDNDRPGTLRAVRVNALFPHLLCAELGRLRPKCRVLHITTDCVFSGRMGKYDESAVHDPVDFYGKSKSLGEVIADSWLNIRCSIIGPEVKNRKSLLEWFLAQPTGGSVPGFTHHLWNGVTTLQYAQFCENIIQEKRFEALRQVHHTLHFVPNETVSKYELLQLFNEVYQRGITVERITGPGPVVDRTLNSKYLSLPKTQMQVAIDDLRRYCLTNGCFA